MGASKRWFPHTPVANPPPLELPQDMAEHYQERKDRRDHTASTPVRYPRPRTNPLIDVLLGRRRE